MLPAATSAQRNYTHGAWCETRKGGSRNQPFWEWAGWWEWMEHHLPVHPGVTSLSHSPHNDPGRAGSRQAMLQRLRGIRVHDMPRHPLSQTGDHTCCQRAGYRNPPGWGSTL